uniref:recQ-mediated genome instability protein 1 n=1 Tax=Erigeron canadensis TaxID=72917 RepID=UPI001CB922AA|nr:recQ-mediated genome instability protein 1 [Erigeron canadensis]
MSSRRRPRIITSSSDEEEEEEVVNDVVQPPPPQEEENDYMESETPNIQPVTLNPNSHSGQIDNSDEEFTDANENLSSSPPPQPTDTSSEESRTSSISNGGMNMNEVSDNPVSRVLEGLGLRLKAEWLDSCIRQLQIAFKDFNGFDNTKKAKLCFEMFLESDMNYCGAGLLPDNVHQMHLVDLPGPFVLQVDEIVNICLPLRERYKTEGSGQKRCLKLSMTDGVQRVFGMEYQPINDLNVFSPAGLKVAISNVNVRHGLLVLVPEVFQVLGGLVKELEDARKRLVTEVNKPPRGKRTRSGVVPPLATRATSAAWPANITHVSQPPNNPVSQRATPMQVDDQGTTPASANRDTPSHSAVPVHREHATPHPPRTEVDSSFSTRRDTVESFPSMGTTSSATLVHREHAAHYPQRTEVDSSFSTYMEDVESFPSIVATHSAIPANREHATHRPQRTDVDYSFSTRREDVESFPSTATTNSEIPANKEHAEHHPPITEVDYPCSTRRENIEPLLSEPATSFSIPVHREHAARHPRRTGLDSLFSTDREDIEGFPSMSTTESCVMENTSAVPIIKKSVETTQLRVREEATVPIPRASPVVVSDDEDVHMAGAEENHSALGQSSECPFTYLSSLFSKWDASKDIASHVEGKIKCFVTGVKRFLYKERSTYELQVYIDDGSLISEILIDHNAVQKIIGFSPDEVNAAMSSADPSRVQGMKDTMKQFQAYLVNFEGTMVVCINEASSLPVATKTEQGCPLSDAWLLLKRLKSSNADQCPTMDPIDLSP